jgi:Tol biopolymer transport system component
LWALPFSLQSLSSSGDSFPIAEEGSFAGVAQDGTLAYEYDPDGDLSTLVWRDRAGELLERVGQPQGGMQAPALSPDGRMVAVTSLESGNQDIWIHDLTLVSKTRVTFEPTSDHSPSWSPDGRQILYRRLEGSKRSILSRAADGTGEITVLTESEASTFGIAWSRDGRYVVYYQYAPEADQDILYLEIDSQGRPSEPKTFLNSLAREEDPALSPDSRYLAYQSNASGRPEIYVRPFPAGTGQWQASFSGGTQPRWRSDGRELYYVASGALMAVPVLYEPGLRLGRPQKLFESSDLLPPAGMPLYDVSADGQRFLTIAALEGDATAPPVIRIVENWLEDLPDRDR